MKTILSLGAGVQSSTMALMAAKGLITPMPDAAIFADTGAEPKGVYEYLDYIESLVPYPVYRVSAGNITEMIMKSCGPEKGANRFAAAPFYVQAHGEREGMLRRQCTREFKVDPIRKKVREICGLKKGEHAPRGQIIAEQWIGISTDEAIRMKPPREKYLSHRWPLIDMGMSRLHCLQWMADNGYRMPSKSACTFCPYRDDKSWYQMKQEDPEAWEEACRVDEYIRQGASGMRDGNQLFVHRSLEPLRTLDLEALAQVNQGDMFGGEFGAECEGMCGV